MCVAAPPVSQSDAAGGTMLSEVRQQGLEVRLTLDRMNEKIDRVNEKVCDEFGALVNVFRLQLIDYR